jgi:hypothetical protein
MRSDTERSTPTPNFGKRVARRITELDASVAGLALCAHVESLRQGTTRRCHPPSSSPSPTSTVAQLP